MMIFINIDIPNNITLEIINFFENNNFDKNIEFLLEKYGFEYNLINKSRLKFLSKSTINSNGCWDWKNVEGQNLYGAFWFGDKGYLPAHRISWEIYNKKIIPNGFIICHTCDRKNCVNPEHLWIGTPSENVRDAYKKGIIKSGDESPSTKIKHSEYDKIIKLFLEGNFKSEIARIYGVSHYAIRRILKLVDKQIVNYYKTKITAELAKEIIYKYQIENLSSDKLSKQYNIEIQIIRDLVRRKTWKFLE